VPVGNASAILRLLEFSPPLLTSADAAVGTWTDPTTLSVSFTFGSVATSRDWITANVGLLWVTVLPNGRLTSANGESNASNDSAVVSLGSWGDAPLVTVAEQNATAATVTLGPPATSVGYSTQVCHPTAREGWSCGCTVSVDCVGVVATRPHSLVRTRCYSCLSPVFLCALLFLP
jgi:hypothetical protein